MHYRVNFEIIMRSWFLSAPINRKREREREVAMCLRVSIYLKRARSEV